MQVLGIDEEKCSGCGQCIKDCPENLFFAVSGGMKVKFDDPFSRCILCGHCIAVCPQEAVIYKDGETALRDPLIMEPEKIINADGLMIFLRARRSVRRFQKRMPPEKSIQYILDAMRYAPTGSNKQGIHFTIISSKEKIAFLSDKVIRLFKAIKIILRILRFFIPFGRRKKGGVLSNGLYRSLLNVLEKAEKGMDPIFFHAPIVIVLSGRPYAHQTQVDGGIALAHGMLAAQAAGLGTCLIGFAHERLILGPLLMRSLGIPRGCKPLGVMALGFPDVRYTAAPPRKPLSFNRL